MERIGEWSFELSLLGLAAYQNSGETLSLPLEKTDFFQSD